jgi:rRNA-processing protein FCF1
MRHTFATFHYMKVVMDADCLIKLAKAQMKEAVCDAFEVAVPSRVRREVMSNAARHPECSVIGENLRNGALQEVDGGKRGGKGEDAVLAAFEAGSYDGIASDDKRFIRRLRLLGVPHIPPAVFVLLLVKQGRLDMTEGLARLDRLAPMISNEEVAVVKLQLAGLRERGA